MSDKNEAKHTLNYCIQPDSEEGRAYGFTSARFEGWLWRDGPRVLLSLIISKQPGRGHLSELIGGIEAAGLRVACPTPLGRMQAILTRKGFTPHTETAEGFGGEAVEVWERATPGQA